MLDHKLKWDIWTDRLNAKSQQRLFFSRNLFSFNVSSRMLQTFYCAFIESVLSFGIVCQFGSPTEAQKKATRRITTMSSKLLGFSFPSMESIYRDRIVKMANSVVGDQRYPLASSFKVLPSGRRYCRPLLKKTKTKTDPSCLLFHRLSNFSVNNGHSIYLAGLDPPLLT